MGDLVDPAGVTEPARDGWSRGPVVSSAGGGDLSVTGGSPRGFPRCICCWRSGGRAGAWGDSGLFDNWDGVDWWDSMPGL